MENNAEILYDLIAQKNFEALSNSQKEMVLKEISMNEYQDLRRAFLAANELSQMEETLAPKHWETLAHAFDINHANTKSKMQLMPMFIGMAASFILLTLAAYIWFWPPKVEQVVSIERVTDTVYVTLPSKQISNDLAKQDTQYLVQNKIAKKQRRANTTNVSPKATNLYVRGGGNLLDEHNKINSLKVDSKELPSGFGFVSL